jgi:hypothetical protein
MVKRGGTSWKTIFDVLRMFDRKFGVAVAVTNGS